MILRCLRTYKHIRYIESAFDEFISFKEAVFSSAIETDIELEAKAGLFFLEFEIFLDYWNKYMSRRGKKDEFKPVFDKAMHS